MSESPTKKVRTMDDIDVRVGDTIRLKGEECWTKVGTFHGWYCCNDRILDAKVDYKVVIMNRKESCVYIQIGSNPEAFRIHVIDIFSVNDKPVSGSYLNGVEV